MNVATLFAQRTHSVWVEDRRDGEGEFEFAFVDGDTWTLCNVEYGLAVRVDCLRRTAALWSVGEGLSDLGRLALETAVAVEPPHEMRPVPALVDDPFEMCRWAILELDRFYADIVSAPIRAQHPGLRVDSLNLHYPLWLSGTWEGFPVAFRAGWGSATLQVGAAGGTTTDARRRPLWQASLDVSATHSGLDGPPGQAELTEWFPILVSVLQPAPFWFEFTATPPAEAALRPFSPEGRLLGAWGYSVAQALEEAQAGHPGWSLSTVPVKPDDRVFPRITPSFLPPSLRAVR